MTLYALLGGALLIWLVAMFAMIRFFSVLNRAEKLVYRINQITASKVQSISTVDEELSLVRAASRWDILKDRASALIGVDLQQAETYPIKWWLVPPLAFLVTLVLMWLASHPLGHHAKLWFVVKYIGSPVIWYLVDRFIFNWFKNRRNTQLVEQFPDALNMIVRSVRVGIPMAEALRTVANDSMEPTKREFMILADKVSIGIPLDIALRELSDRVKLTEYQFFLLPPLHCRLGPAAELPKRWKHWRRSSVSVLRLSRGDMR